MSITTMGWGSGATTTVGFGAITGVVSAPTPGPAQKSLLPVLLETKWAKFCKISDTVWATKLAAANTDLDTLDSNIARITSLLRLVEATDPEVLGVQWALDCKIDDVDYDNKLATSDVSLDSLESKISALRAQIHTLESSLRIRLRNQRINS